MAVDVDNPKSTFQSGNEGRMRPMAIRRRTAARLAAIQLSYSMELTGQPLMDALPVFLQAFAGEIVRQMRIKKMDEEHFHALVSGIEDKKPEIDAIIEQNLSDGWTLDRLARPELVVLRAGTFEIQNMSHIPARAILSEYASLADAFQADVGFVNALLDRLAQQFRDVEMPDSREE